MVMSFQMPRRAWKAISFLEGVCSSLSRPSQPTLNPEPCIWKDIVIFDRFSVHAARDVKRGDVVSLRSPVNPKEVLVKRVVAIQGDAVQTLPPYPVPEVKVPEGHVWVEGDESFWTLDSNSWGPIPQVLIDAKLVFVLWPLNRFGTLKAPALRDTSTPRSPALSDPAWKRQMAEIEREKWRSTRVRS